MGSYKWGYKSPNMGYKYSYPNYNPIFSLPINLQVEFMWVNSLSQGPLQVPKIVRHPSKMDP